MSIIFVSVLAAILLGLINGMLQMFATQQLESKFILIPGFDENMAVLCVKEITTAIAMGVASLFYYYVNKHHSIMEHPFIDFIGVMVGTALLLGLYCLYRAYLKTYFNQIPVLFNNNIVKDLAYLKSIRL